MRDLLLRFGIVVFGVALAFGGALLNAWINRWVLVGG